MSAVPSNDDIRRFRQLDAMFDALLDQPTDQREAWIDAATVDDADLRERLRAMHRTHAAAQEFLATPATGTRPRPDLHTRLAEAVRSRYRIDGTIGRGGMASVFLAHDERHARPVAIKVLRPDIRTHLSERGADRFLEEIRTLARLQHPHIVPLYDSGEHDGLLYYVMPFVAGPSLRKRLHDDGPLDVGDAVRIACTLADALAFAHAQGVVHRDLKPENVLFQRDQPLITDFGIALALARAGEADGAVDATASADDGARLTGRGVLLGTPRYMAPEQAAGDAAIDHRADIHALGALLYEMITGDPPHLSTTLQGTLAKIRSERPVPADAIRDTVPPGVSRVIERALAKLPSDRYRDATEFAAALRRGLDEAPSSGERRSVPAPVGGGVARRWGTAAVVAAGGIAAGAWLATTIAEPRVARPVPMLLELATTPPLGARASLHLTQGGSMLYAADQASGGAIVARGTRETATHRLDGTADVVGTALSPDGQWIAYTTASDRLQRVAATGGIVSDVAGIFRLDRVTWVGTDVIVAEGNGLRGLAWIDASGGAWHALTRVDSTAGESQHVAPYAVRGGRTVLFIVWRRRAGPDGLGGELAVTSLDPEDAVQPRAHRLLGPAASSVVGMLDDWVLYVGADFARIYAVRFDEAQRALVGAPVLAYEHPGGGIQSATLAADGTLAYVVAPLGFRIARSTSAARDVPLAIGPLRGAMHPRVAPDGRRLVVQSRGPTGFGLVVHDLVSGDSARIATPNAALQPVWTPDGRSIVFLSTVDGDAFWRVPVAGGTPVRVVTANGAFSPSVSADGRSLFYQRRLAGRLEIWRAPLDGSAADTGSAGEVVVTTARDAAFPAPSPDGRWIAYATNESGRYELAIRPIEGDGSARRLTTLGGTEPVWSHDGRHLYYRRGGEIRRLAFVGAGTTVRADEPVAAALLDDPLPARHFDPLPDGSVVTIAPLDSAPPRAFVVPGWAEQVRTVVRRSGQ